MADHREPPAKDVAVRAKLVINEYFGNDKLITEFLFRVMRFKGKMDFFKSSVRSSAKFLNRTPVRTFLLYPVLIVGWEALFRSGRLEVTPAYIVLMVIGYFLYKVSTTYRVTHGEGGPGEKWEKEPPRLITTGPYAFTRNPVYLGHIIFMLGLALTLHSLLAAILAVVVGISFHRRILQDEKRLASVFGQQYFEYKSHVRRWIPGVF